MGSGVWVLQPDGPGLQPGSFMLTVLPQERLHHPVHSRAPRLTRCCGLNCVTPKIHLFMC